jgi:hypothetical protein
MGGQRGSDRLVDVKASCGHMTMATIHGSQGGPVSRANVGRAASHPCFQCMPKQECGCLVTTIYDKPGRHYCGKEN